MKTYTHRVARIHIFCRYAILLQTVFFERMAGIWQWMNNLVPTLAWSFLLVFRMAVLSILSLWSKFSKARLCKEYTGHKTSTEAEKMSDTASKLRKKIWKLVLLARILSCSDHKEYGSGKGSFVSGKLWWKLSLFGKTVLLKRAAGTCRPQLIYCISWKSNDISNWKGCLICTALYLYWLSEWRARRAPIQKVLVWSWKALY